MKIKFDLTDEVTITNTTVKISAWIQGVINDQDRPALEAASLDLAKKLFPDASWAFSNFTYQPDGFTFRVQATTRIDSTQNDQLAQRCDQLSNQGKLTIQISNIDPTIPLHQKREAESNLRQSLIEKAQAEAEKLGGRLARVDFIEAGNQHMAANTLRGSVASYAVAGAAPDSVNLGHSEKIYLAAALTIDTRAKEQLNG